MPAVARTLNIASVRLRPSRSELPKLVLPILLFFGVKWITLSVPGVSYLWFFLYSKKQKKEWFSRLSRFLRNAATQISQICLDKIIKLYLGWKTSIYSVEHFQKVNYNSKHVEASSVAPDVNKFSSRAAADASHAQMINKPRRSSKNSSCHCMIAWKILGSIETLSYLAPKTSINLA